MVYAFRGNEMIKVSYFINKPSDFIVIKSMYEAMINDNYNRFKVCLLQNIDTLNISSLPFADYSIITSPYNINFKNLSKVSNKIIHINYGPLIKRFLQYPINDLQYIWKYFVGDKFNEAFLDFLGQSSKVVKVGHPKFDLIQQASNKLKTMKKYDINPKQKIMLYAPTIQLSSGISSGYSMFANVIGDIINVASELKMTLVIKGHPKLFLDVPKDKHIDFSGLKNVIFTQTNEYVDLLQIADVFISDPSGIVFEYLYTKKPIILLLPISGFIRHPQEIPVNTNPAIIEFAKVSYLPQNRHELKNIILDILNGKDNLYNSRNILLNKFFFNSEDSGKRCANYIFADYCKNKCPYCGKNAIITYYKQYDRPNVWYIWKRCQNCLQCFFVVKND